VGNAPVSKYTVSFGLSAALSSVINALLVVVKETSPCVLAAMKKVTGHQWVTHSAIVLILFGFFGWLLARVNGGQGLQMSVNRLVRTIMAGVVTGGVIIIGFYLIGD